MLRTGATLMIARNLSAPMPILITGVQAKREIAVSSEELLIGCTVKHSTDTFTPFSSMDRTFLHGASSIAMLLKPCRMCLKLNIITIFKKQTDLWLRFCMRQSEMKKKRSQEDTVTYSTMVSTDSLRQALTHLKNCTKKLTEVVYNGRKNRKRNCDKE